MTDTDLALQETVSIDEALALAVQLHRQGCSQDAEAIYSRILELIPNQPDALHFLGILSHQQGKSDKAVRLIKKAIEVNPNFVDAYSNLGNIYKETAQLKEAEAAYRYAITLNSEHVAAYNNLGVVLKNQGRLEEAKSAYRRAIEIKPDDIEAYHNLGNILRRQGLYEEAATAYRKAIEVQPDHPEAYYNLGKTLRAYDQTKEAVSVYRKAVNLKPDFPEARYNLGMVLSAMGETEKAAQVYREWLKLDPENTIAKHMLASCTEQEVPERASDDYVQQIFDGFANTFDDCLEELDYRAPELVGNVVRDNLKPQNNSLQILDAGCGTGLCGPLLSPYASSLIGVDLSQGMLDKAKHRDVYDDLLQGELCSFLTKQLNKYDLIVSADTLCYFGDLVPVFSAVANAITESGYLVFTVELAVEPKADEEFHLNPHGRYSHSKNYILEALDKCDFQVVVDEIAVLRKEAGNEVVGLLISAKKINGF